MSLDIYVMAGSYENEPFASTHIQRKGALIAAILDICSFLGIEDNEGLERHLEDLTLEDLPWEEEKLLGMDTEQLIKVEGCWQDRESIWSNDRGYSVSVIKTRLSA